MQGGSEFAESASTHRLQLAGPPCDGRDGEGLWPGQAQDSDAKARVLWSPAGKHKGRMGSSHAAFDEEGEPPGWAISVARHHLHLFRRWLCLRRCLGWLLNEDF